MEKQHKPLNPVSNKRRRKASLSTPTASTEPKTMKLAISDTVTNIKPLVKPQSAKFILSPVESNIVESKPEATQTKKKKKAKKPKGMVVIENNVSVTSPVELKKVKKRQAETNSSTAASPLKKKKKQKELLAELNAMKEEIIGPEVLNMTREVTQEKQEKGPLKTAVSKTDESSEEGDKYPVLKDKELIEKFLKVPMTNNQKGRIRQAVKLSLQDSTTTMFPDIINGKIQAILKSSVDLTDSELRRVRILYNMLKTALEKPEKLEEGVKSPRKKKDKKKKEVKDVTEDGEEKEKAANKVKGPKRYVVFLGNLPLDINKEKIMEHFRELNEHIVDIRLPKVAPGVKSAIAFVELSNEPSYELALSKHHSMLDNKRIKVLYTTQQKSKISRGEAKGKSAKLIALQKAGKLVGSTPTAKKRSHRRTIMKKAKALEAAALSQGP